MVRSNREEVNIIMQTWREFEEIILKGVEKNYSSQGRARNANVHVK